jgi:hypothetical protein
MKKINYWKTTDIRISKDSVGFYTATHKYAGVLIDGCFYNNRTECRKEAVDILKQLKSEAE